MHLKNLFSASSLFLILSWVRTLMFLLLVQDVPVSFGQENVDSSNCSVLNFTCGDLIKNISYPFWGNLRPPYCGMPGYKLDCLDGGITEIEIVSEKYRVLGIDQGNKIMTIIRNDFLGEDDACLADGFDTITPNFILFNYPPDNLTLNYGCPAFPGSNAFPNKFNCQTNETSYTDAYYWSGILASAGISSPPNSVRCWKSIEIPVTVTALRRLSNDPSTTTLSSVLREGFDVGYSDAGCRECVKNGGECRYSPASLTCFCPSSVTNRTMCSVPGPRNSNVKRKIIIGTTATMGGVILALSIFMLIRCLRKKSSPDDSSLTRFWKKETTIDDHQNVEAFFRNYGSLAPKRFKYMDVKKITNSFKEKLGQGGYGSVFKGQLHGGRLVAVKVLFSKSKTNDGEEFINEVASISRTSHVNIVTLLGFCFERNKRALIYEFMPNGSLDKFIYGEKLPLESGLTLGWEALYQVAIGIARGLEYLHRGCNTRILHFDIKPHNILLDENFCPKISDFGLAKLCPGKESIISMLGTRGTAGYIAPEVFDRNFGAVSHKSDVYSYGMMVLEMVGGRKNIDVKVGMDHSSQLYFPHWIYDRLNLDEDLGLHGVMTEEREKATRKMIIVGLWCIQTNPSSRPSMSKVLEMLEGSVEALQMPPKPFLSSPSRSPPLMDSHSIISSS